VTPTVEIRLRNKVLMSVAGDAKYVTGERIDTDLTLDSTLLSSPIVLKGEFVIIVSHSLLCSYVFLD
jgi:hypothetical protein